MRFSPSGNLEEAYEFSQEVVGGAVPKNFFPAVEKRTSGGRAERTFGGISGTWYQGSAL